MRVLVIANGELDPRDAAIEADLVLCADGGTARAAELGLVPDVVIGDLDSLSPGARARLEAEGTRFVVHPASKDETDLELALLYAAQVGATQAVVLGARGGRIDHELGNLLLLAHPRLRDLDVRLRVGAQEVRLVRKEAVFSGAPGDLLSLLPIGGDAIGVTTDGLAYPLDDEDLLLGPARGVSNVFAVCRPSVRVRAGLLLAVHSPVRTEERRAPGMPAGEGRR